MWWWWSAWAGSPIGGFGFAELGIGKNSDFYNVGVGGGIGNFWEPSANGNWGKTVEIPIGQFITSIVGAIGSSSSGPAPFYDRNNSDPYNFGRNPNPYGPIKFKIVLLLIEIDI